MQIEEAITDFVLRVLVNPATHSSFFNRSNYVNWLVEKRIQKTTTLHILIEGESARMSRM